MKNTKLSMMRSLLSIQTGAERRKKIFRGKDGAKDKIRFLFYFLKSNG
jgi:hypothetical protein